MERCAGYLHVLIKAAAFVFFALQMIFAIEKYNRGPTVTSLGTKSLKDLEKPIDVAVCKLSQFDYEKAASIGYKWQIHFFSGQLCRGKDSEFSGPQEGSLRKPQKKLFFSDPTTKIYN